MSYIAINKSHSAKGDKNIQDREKEFFFYMIHRTIVKTAVKNVVITTIIDGF